MSTTDERITIEVQGAPMGAYVARPVQDGKWPGVLLFMEVFGINRHIRTVANRVAAEGYVVMAPDVFHRTAPGVELGYDEEGLAKGIDLMNRARASEVDADVAAAFAALEARKDVAGNGIGAMGFCFGGHIAYRAACNTPVVATVSFYGGGVAVGAPANEGPPTVELSRNIKGRILCLFGDNDAYIPHDQIAKVRETLERDGVRHEVVVYPGVGHGFFCDERGDYNKDAADDAWQRLTRLFAEELR